MSTARGPFGPFPRGCGTATSARNHLADSREFGERAERTIRQLTILVIVLTNAILAVRGEDAASVIAYAAAAVITAVCTAAIFVRIAPVRGAA